MHKEYETYERQHYIKICGSKRYPAMTVTALARALRYRPDRFLSERVIPRAANFYSFPAWVPDVESALPVNFIRDLIPTRRKERWRIEWALEQGPGNYSYTETHRKTHKPKFKPSPEQVAILQKLVDEFPELSKEAPEEPFATLVSDEEVADYYSYSPEPEPAHVGQMDTEQKLAALIRRVDQVYGEILDQNKYLHSEIERVIKCVRKLMAPDLLDQ